LLPGHFWIADQYRFTTAVRQACRGIFQGHCACESRTFLGGDIGGHAYPSDRGSPGDIVDHQHPFQPDPGFVYVNYLEWTEIVGKRENVIHPYFSLFRQA
jgi:hypothetical protein